MLVVFRCDASHQIGSGHVMRCLTLADALNVAGVTCQFICRAHKGHLADYIRGKGYLCHLLCADSEQTDIEQSSNVSAHPQHAEWLGVSWRRDAAQTATIIGAITPDWLVVDHYGLDHNWERALHPYYQQLMVIDDLADRPHLNTDILLDQTLGRQDGDYRELVGANTKLLLGPKYALLRPEFAAWREVSLKRRDTPELKSILVNLGGVDNDNVTGDVVKALAASELPADCEITVVMGGAAPHLLSVQQQAQTSDLNIRVLSGVSNMAQLMAHADVAIGAAGSTAWERCCLGLPAVMVVLAQNQQMIASELSRIGACEVTSAHALATELPNLVHALSASGLKTMSAKARHVCAGDGARLVTQAMLLA